MLENIPYKASCTSDRFLLYEMKITARLMSDGLSDNEIMERVCEDNMFQYPTEKSVKRMVRTCIGRLKNLDDESLVEAIAREPQDVAKQICVYAMMKQYRVIGEFMVTVIGEKYRLGDNSFGKIDINSYFARLQEQSEVVAGWSDRTIRELKGLLLKLLVDGEYLDDTKSTVLNPVWLHPVLENVIREKGEDALLLAFNRFD